MKSVIAHGVLALLGLLFAYRTWAHEEKEEQLPGEITIAECDPSKLSELVMDTPTTRATYRPKREGTAVQYWVTTQTKKPKTDKPNGDKKADDKKADDKKSDAAKTEAAKTDASKAEPKKDDKLAKDEKSADATQPAAPKQPRAYDADAPVTFLANQKFDEAMKSLAPLRGIRKLGVVPKQKLKDFGLDKGDEGVVLREQCGDLKVELQIGGRTFGSGDQYARDPKTGEAYLVRGQTVMDLQSALYRFMQSELHNFTLPEVDEAIIKADGKERKLLHRNRQVPAEARWVDAAAPDKRNELFGNYFQRLSRMKVKSYLGEGKEPGSDLQIDHEPVKPVMTIEYRGEGKFIGKLELVRVNSKQGNFYYARTETTKRWTVMFDTIGKQVEDDVAIVVGSEEPPAPNLSIAPATQSSATPASGTPAHAAPAPAPTPAHAAPASGTTPAIPSALPPSHPKIH